MDARDIIADAACRPDWNKYETANYILQRLADTGFSVIHRDENHGPTMERAAEIIEKNTISYANTNSLRPRLEGDRQGMEYASAIRLMGERK